jgi:hypothetical protein
MKLNHYKYIFWGFAAGYLIVTSPLAVMYENKYPTGAGPEQTIPPPASWIDDTPVRGEPQLIFYLNQFMYKCNVCHVDAKILTCDCDKNLKTPLAYHLPFGAHRDMVFNHALNLRCFNCHNCANLETYINHDGSEIPGDQPVLLCRKCHGTTYRDWEAGAHGRSNGSWDASHGMQVKLTCNQCHNPHAPHFPRLIPRPSPSTVRIPHFSRGSHHE